MELITTLLKKSKKSERSTKKEIKKILKESIKTVAKKLHNTESVCKSNYLDPELIKYFTVDCEGFLKNFYLNGNKTLCSDEKKQTNGCFNEIKLKKDKCNKIKNFFSNQDILNSWHQYQGACNS